LSCVIVIAKQTWTQSGSVALYLHYGQYFEALSIESALSERFSFS
jgi:hypothetical protein